MHSTRRDSVHSLVFSTRSATSRSHSHELNRDTTEKQISETKLRYHAIIAALEEIRGHEIPLFHAPQYADQWPIGFMQSGQWRRIWNGQQFELDPFLRYGITETGGNTPWVHEPLFKGVKYRLTIDPQTSLEGLPTFTEGMIVKCGKWNCDAQRYIVDHCAYKDDVNAYLKVVCYNEYHNTYDIQSYPPIILVVPLTHSNVREHPNLTGKTQTSDSIKTTRPSDRKTEQHRTTCLSSVTRRLFRVFS